MAIIVSYGHPRCTIPHFAYLLLRRPFRPRLLYLQLFLFRVAVAVVIAVEDCSTEEADVELLTMMCLEHAVMSAARSVETLFEAHNLTKQCVQRQQGCLQCCRASCRHRVESTVEVVHKSAVASWCAPEPKKNIERCRLLLTDSQSQFCLRDKKGVSRGGRGAHPCIHKKSSRKNSCRDFERASSLLEISRSLFLYPQQFFQKRNLVQISRKQAAF